MPTKEPIITIRPKTREIDSRYCIIDITNDIGTSSTALLVDYIMKLDKRFQLLVLQDTLKQLVMRHDGIDRNVDAEAFMDQLREYVKTSP